jgi:hypothetical protein
MTKVNFKTITFKDIEDKEQLFDCQKELGNAIYMQAANIEERDLGRKIYYANGDVELTDQQVEVVKRFAARYSYVLREAVETALTPKP